MFLDEAREYLLKKPATTEGTPFGPEVLVYKVKRKMFAILSPDDIPGRMNLKCDPDRALELRAQHEAILPGYHMNKKHWNTLVLDGSVSGKLVKELIDHSYDLVVAGLTKKLRSELEKENASY